jgi:hypothetical protein
MYCIRKMFTVGVRNDPHRGGSMKIIKQLFSKLRPAGASGGATVGPDTLGQTSMGPVSLAASELTPSQLND